MAQVREEHVYPARITDDVGTIEGWAQDGGVGDFAAIAAADTGLIDRRDRIVTQRIIQLLDAERGTARQSDAGMIAGADIFIDAEAWLHHAFAVTDRLVENRLFTPLLVEHAFR